MFFLQQTPVECPEEAEVRGLEYLPAAESPQVGPGPLLQLLEVEVEALRQGLHAAETLQPLSDGLPMPHQVQSKNTIAGVADKSAAWLAFEFV